ncbi:hypothetical protein [Haladaptatus sp. DYF46]|uniref:hypothetical protein n=1 Tax=Haladaptatus sp. DYF46 TaxID=2886041 RepID=UPI001E41D6A0|nr:hypothetical protein [Haladaptatus sp. DYF46]
MVVPVVVVPAVVVVVVPAVVVPVVVVPVVVVESVVSVTVVLVVFVLVAVEFVVGASASAESPPLPVRGVAFPTTRSPAMSKRESTRGTDVRV